LIRDQILLLSHSGRARLYKPLLLGTTIALATSAGAQTTTAAPETVTPPTLRPDLPPADSRLTLPQVQPLAPPPGAEGVRVTPARIVVEGAFPAVADEMAVLTRSIEGRPITLADLYRVASAIEAAHARRGYVLARVTVPPQRIANGGVVRIVVVDGFVEAVDAGGVPRRVRAVVAARLAGLRDRHRIAIGQIERQLLLAGEVTGVTLRSTLARGERPGGVRLIVEGNWRPLRATVRGDNAVDRSLSGANGTVQLSLNGVLGLGETIYGYVASSDPLRPFASDTRVRVLGGGLIVAPGNGRLSLNPEATLSRTLPIVAADVPRVEGRLTRYALRAGYVLAQTRESRLALDLSVEAIEQRTVATDFATDLARDHYAAARLGVSESRSGARASWSLAAQVGQGLGTIGGAESLPPTRQDATGRFTKLTAQAQSSVAAGGLVINTTAFAQTSFGRPLLRAEQFQLEGSNAVSAYVGGVTTTDEGITARTEVAHRVAVRRLALAPYVFGAAGIGGIARPTAVESARLRAAALGAGVRSSILRGHADVGVEYAYGIATIPALDGHGRVNMTASARF
jgi:hemolysin activation/secretion protein